MKKLGYAILIFLLAGWVKTEAQEMIGVPIIKPEVENAQIMFKRTVWRRIDLEEKQNRPFFSRNGEVPRLLIEAVKEGLIKPYMSDSCVNIMPDSIFISQTSIERQAPDGGFGGFDGGFGGFTTPGEETSAPQQPAGPEYDPIPAEVFTILYLKEDLIFDRNRSRMMYFVRSMSIALPASAGVTWNPGAFEKKVAHFKYEEVVELFRGPYAHKALWFNNQNQAAHRNYGDAFELRLFRAPIVRLSNAENLDIRQQVSDAFEAIKMQQKYEIDLMEYESQLWEY